MEKGEPFCTVGENADWCSHCRKQYGDTSKNGNIKMDTLTMELCFYPAMPLLRPYPEKSKTLIWKNISNPMFIAVLFTVTKNWKGPVSISGWADKTTMGHLHNGILLSHKHNIFDFLRFSLFIFRERGREGEKEGEKYQCVVASHMASTGDLALKPRHMPWLGI